MDYYNPDIGRGIGFVRTAFMEVSLKSIAL